MYPSFLIGLFLAVEVLTKFLEHPYNQCFFKDFLNRREGREKERERNINVLLLLAHPQPGTCPATQACALTGSQTNDPLVRRPVLNPLSHTSQGITSVLNSASHRLLISIFFRSFLGVLICSFIWAMFLCLLILAASLCLCLCIM